MSTQTNGRKINNRNEINVCHNQGLGGDLHFYLLSHKSPTPGFFNAHWRNWLARENLDLKVPGSYPGWATKKTELICMKWIMFFWQLPQILLGEIICSKRDRRISNVDGVDVYITRRFEGVSLGNKIFLNPDTAEGPWLVKHEFGHVIQSRMLGWLYIPVILIPSFLWFQTVCVLGKLFKDLDTVTIYYKFYTESWANKLMNIQLKVGN